jgi:hypothetical protein
MIAANSSTQFHLGIDGIAALVHAHMDETSLGYSLKADRRIAKHRPATPTTPMLGSQ